MIWNEVFPVSIIQARVRKTVLSKQATIFYEFKNSVVYLVYLFNTTKNPNKIR